MEHVVREFVLLPFIHPVNIGRFSCSQLWTMPHEEIKIRKDRQTGKKSRHKSEYVISTNEWVVREYLGNSVKFQIN